MRLKRLIATLTISALVISLSTVSFANDTLNVSTSSIDKESHISKLNEDIVTGEISEKISQSQSKNSGFTTQAIVEIIAWNYSASSSTNYKPDIPLWPFDSKELWGFSDTSMYAIDPEQNDDLADMKHKQVISNNFYYNGRFYTSGPTTSNYDTYIEVESPHHYECNTGDTASVTGYHRIYDNAGTTKLVDVTTNSSATCP